MGMRNSYAMEEITQMRCELVAIWHRLYVRNEWNLDDMGRYHWLDLCLRLLGFKHHGGDVFELTDGTELL